MKKSKISILITGLLIFSASLFAAFNPIVNVNTTFKYNSEAKLTANGDWYTAPADSYKTVQDYLYRSNEVPGLFSFGFDWETDHLRFVSLVDLREGYDSILTNTSYSNIPFVGNTVSAILDMNFPRLAFVEGGYGGFYGSIGRRQIKWGPGLYDMAINDSAPYLDNLYLSYTNSGWTYNFIQVGFSNVALNGPEKKSEFNKNLFAHRLTWANDHIRVGIGELNMVYNTVPSLLDLTPLGIWHNLYQDEHSNVLMHLSMEGKIKDARVYGVFAMDDLDLPGEPENNVKPAAMGYTLGFEWHVLEGNEYKDATIAPSSYLLSEATFKEDNGLNIGLDLNYTTNYMYNRRSYVDDPNTWWGHDEIGKYTVPMRYHTFSGYISDKDAYFLGFPYGPGVFLGTLYADWQAANYYVNGSIEYMMRGSARIEDDLYKLSLTENMKANWFKLKDLINHILNFNVDGGYTFLDQNITLKGAFHLAYDITRSKVEPAATLSFAWSL